MDKPISVGDLVMVVRPSLCGCTENYSRTFQVSHIWDASVMELDCLACGRSRNTPAVAWAPNAEFCVEISRLKRLDPDALKDDVPTKEELTA